MIDLYYCPTPNGLKMTMFLEEAELPYRIIPVRLGKGEQFRPEFLAISLNNKIPAMVDHDPPGGGAPVSLFESGAMLLYLAEKTGRLIPTDLRGRLEVMKWLFWQVGGLGPMAGQIGHFNVYAPEKVPYAIERYTKETNRLYGVLNRRSPTAPSSPNTRSPISPAIPGSCRTRRTAGPDDFPHLSAGSRRSRRGPPPSGPMGHDRHLFENSEPLSDEARKALFDRPRLRFGSERRDGERYRLPASMMRLRKARVRSSEGAPKIFSGGPSSWTMPP